MQSTVSCGPTCTVMELPSRVPVATPLSVQLRLWIGKPARGVSVIVVVTPLGVSHEKLATPSAPVTFVVPPSLEVNEKSLAGCSLTRRCTTSDSSQRSVAMFFRAAERPPTSTLVQSAVSIGEPG